MVINIQEQINTAINFQKNKQFEEAEKLYSEVLDLDNNNPNVLNLFGLLKFQMGKYEEALGLIDCAVKLYPCAYFYENLGLVYSAIENYKSAIAVYQKALSYEPENFGVWFNLAMSQKKMGDIESSISSYYKALEINPDSYDTYFNLGNIYFQITNDVEKSVKCYQKAFDLRPNDKETEYCLAMACVKAKQFELGWKYSESRPSKSLAFYTHSLSQPSLKVKPEWHGEDISDKKLFVYYEAAFGDTIMFARYLPLLKDKCAKVYYKSQVNHVQLMKDSDLGCEVLMSADNLDYDYHVALMSIPYVLKLNKESDIPFKDGYIKANPGKIASFKEKFFNNDKFKVGIKWKGNPGYATNRIIKLKYFYQLFDMENIQFYSVQKGEGEEELQDAAKYNIINLADSFNDFSDTAAAIENLDLVICNDTSVAHLAGAMGKKCFTLLPYVQDWRWLGDTSYCSWYSNTTIFQQKEPGNWEEVFQRVNLKLSELMEK